MTIHQKLNILIAGYEVAPFYKRGGLGDVLGSLPIALNTLRINTRVVMPYYNSIKKKFPQKKIASFPVVFDKKEEEVIILKGNLPNSNVPIYFLGNPKLIGVINLRKKDIEDFVFFDLAVAGLINWLEDQGSFIPDLVHCNDWHTALIPLLLQKRMKSKIKTLLTIHNLGYQGRGSFSALDQAGIEDEDLKILKRSRPITKLNALGEGILHANKISTVSSRYAKEISQIRKRTQIYRYFRLRERMLSRSDKLIGILNGTDTKIWNPQEDKFIPKQYGITDVSMGKKKNKEILLDELSLTLNKPTFAFIGRMATQKGIDLILKTAEELVGLGINLILLGSGLKTLEQKVQTVSQKYSNVIKAELIFTEEMAHKLYAAADFLLMPSNYEPCGLVQMIGMRYGTIPIATRTGGLMDTIDDGRTGFLFQKGSSHDQITTIKKALRAYKDPEKFEKMRKEAMKEDFSWDKSATLYKKLYESILEN